MGDKTTFAVQVDKSSELYEDFEAYKDRRGFTSRSETLRHLMRQEFDDEDEPVGVAAAVSKIAGEQLTEQLGVLSRYIIVMAVSLMAMRAAVVRAGGSLRVSDVHHPARRHRRIRGSARRESRAVGRCDE